MNLKVTSITLDNCLVFQLQGKILSEADAEILKDSLATLTIIM